MAIVLFPSCEIHLVYSFEQSGFGEVKMEFSKDDLKEAKRQIDSTLHKLRETIKTFESKENVERYKSQITLAKRRVKAFEIANWLIKNELDK
ncbi:MAG: hypothetical protein ACI4MP_09020 [Candidatus Ventricola sp.]